MELFISNVNLEASTELVTQELAKMLHGGSYTRYSKGGLLLNFKVKMFRDKKSLYSTNHSGCGSVTLPTEEIGNNLLNDLTGPRATRYVKILGQELGFARSRHVPRADVVELCRRLPYEDPYIRARREQILKKLSHRIDVSLVQFGWQCRDGTVSLEWERSYGHGCQLFLDHASRQLHVRGQESANAPYFKDGVDCPTGRSGEAGSSTNVIDLTRDSDDLTRDPDDDSAGDSDEDSEESVNDTVRARCSQVRSAERPCVQSFVSRYHHIKDIITTDAEETSIIFAFYVPPAFETDLKESDNPDLYKQWRAQRKPWSALRPQRPLRRRLVHFGDDHTEKAPFVSLLMRVICSTSALGRFTTMARTAGLPFTESNPRIARLGLFSPRRLRELRDWLSDLPWLVAFNLEVLQKKRLLHTVELLSLRPSVDRLIREHGEKSVAQLIRQFELTVRELEHDSAETASKVTLLKTFDRFVRGLILEDLTSQSHNTAQGRFDCLHITVTPSSIIPNGQSFDRSNRVIRSYAGHEHNFVRVQFTDEDDSLLRFDREVDGTDFVRNRFGRVMREGLTIADHHLEMVAYSQSALKDHAVWFVRPFKMNGRSITAEYIRKRLGKFDSVIYWPSLYGARMSQAFTTTDSSVKVEVEEVLQIPDIEREDDNGTLWQFTDGVGTISPALANEVLKALQENQRHLLSNKSRPRAFQIRFAGSKGMVSVDYRMRGRVLCLRKSMIKFEDWESREIEVANVYDAPLKFFLNRPMITILESLGVPIDVFMALQKSATAETYAAEQSFDRAAHLLDMHGLGKSFRLSNVFSGLKGLGIALPKGTPPIHWPYDTLTRRLVSYGIHHALRDIKHQARIPVPMSWTLVGIADLHSVLEEFEIYACVDSPQGDERLYLEGPVVVTRSPAIAAGDIQVLTAVGRPPPGSPYDQEPLPNTVVFSVKGKRPTPSYLGGGDLDGDLYNLSQYAGLFPRKCHAPASYRPAPRKKLDRPSTIIDVIDHVVNFIVNDNLGKIATTFLTIADQSPQGVFAIECTGLAQLHSDAVDFQKSGEPVPSSMIPRTLFNAKPDWKAPETITPDAEFYESPKAIGCLFRAITLPDVAGTKAEVASQLRDRSDRMRLDKIVAQINTASVGNPNDVVSAAIVARVSEALDVTPEEEPSVIRAVMTIFQSYQRELCSICLLSTLSHTRHIQPLTEEEVMLGTIIGRSPLQRKDSVAQVQEQTSTLVSGIRSKLCEDDDFPSIGRLAKAWMAWRLSVHLSRKHRDIFGSNSFGFIALGIILDDLRAREPSQKRNSTDLNGTQRRHKRRR